MKKVKYVKPEEIELMEIVQMLAFLYLDGHPDLEFINQITGKPYSSDKIIKTSKKMIDILRTHIRSYNEERNNKRI